MRVLALALLLVAAPAAALPFLSPAVTAHVDDVADRVVGSRNSDVYHRPNCGHARRIYDSNLVSWPNAVAARESGYRACRVCSPG